MEGKDEENHLPVFGKLLSNSLESSPRCTCNQGNERSSLAKVHPMPDMSSSLDSLPMYLTDEDETELKTRYRHSGPAEISINILTPVPQKPLLFVTYAGDNDKHINEVMRLCLILIKLTYDVKCDMFEGGFHHAKRNGMPCAMSEMMLNTNDWIERHFQRARYVIVCISPLYSRYISDMEERPCPTENHLHTKYIYNRIQSELIANRCQNKRFIPILFSNSGAKKSDTPPALKSTLLYQHPDHQNLLKSFLSSNLKRKPTEKIL